MEIIKTARKEYQCAKCGKVIRPGKKYRRISYYANGKSQSRCECVLCDRDMPLKALKLPSMAGERNRLVRDVYDLPPNPVARFMVKMYMLGTLAVDYTNTILDIASQMRISETKKLSRHIRQTIDEYEGFASQNLKAFGREDLAGISEMFESVNIKVLNDLCSTLDKEYSQESINANYMMLIKSAYMALAIIRTMKRFDVDCALFLTNSGLPTRTIIAPHFVKLELLIPEYIGDHYHKDSPAVERTVSSLYSDLSNIDLYDEHGKV